MQEFTNHNLTAMKAKIAEVLNDYGFQNVEFTTGSARYSSTEATIKLVAKVKGTVSRKESDLSQYARMDNIVFDAVGPKGEKLVEYHTRKPKYPYIYVNANGTRYKTSTAGARKMFGTIT